MNDEKLVVITTRIPEALRRELRSVLAKDGLTVQDFLANSVQNLVDKAIQYVGETDDGFYDEANIRWLKGSIAQMSEGKIVTKTIEELERMADE